MRTTGSGIAAAGGGVIGQCNNCFLFPRVGVCGGGGRPEARFQSHLNDPAHRWKLSTIDLESRDRCPGPRMHVRQNQHPGILWFTVEADDKRRPRLNGIRHILSKVPHCSVGDDSRPPQNE